VRRRAAVARFAEVGKMKLEAPEKRIF
jgi:hypothetical protein